MINNAPDNAYILDQRLLQESGINANHFKFKIERPFEQAASSSCRYGVQ